MLNPVRVHFRKELHGPKSEHVDINQISRRATEAYQLTLLHYLGIVVSPPETPSLGAMAERYGELLALTRARLNVEKRMRLWYSLLLSFGRLRLRTGSSDVETPDATMAGLGDSIVKSGAI